MDASLEVVEVVEVVGNLPLVEEAETAAEISDAVNSLSTDMGQDGASGETSADESPIIKGKAKFSTIHLKTPSDNMAKEWLTVTGKLRGYGVDFTDSEVVVKTPLKYFSHKSWSNTDVKDNPERVRSFALASVLSSILIDGIFVTKERDDMDNPLAVYAPASSGGYGLLNENPIFGAIGAADDKADYRNYVEGILKSSWIALHPADVGESPSVTKKELAVKVDSLTLALAAAELGKLAGQEMNLYTMVNSGVAIPLALTIMASQAYIPTREVLAKIGLTSEDIDARMFIYFPK
jgi:hypothetical protein